MCDWGQFFFVHWMDAGSKYKLEMMLFTVANTVVGR